MTFGMEMKLYNITIYLLIMIAALVVLLTGSLNGSIAIGVHPNRLVVFDYWEGNSIAHHNIVLFNPNDSLVSVDVLLEEINIAKHLNDTSCILINNAEIPSNSLIILDYPNINECMNRSQNSTDCYLYFSVDGKRGGLLPPSLKGPPFEITNGKIVSNCSYGGEHLENIWFEFDGLIAQKNASVIVKAMVMCLSKEYHPHRIIFPPKRLENSLDIMLIDLDDLIIKEGNPIISEAEITLIVPICDANIIDYSEIAININTPNIKKPEVLYIECIIFNKWKWQSGAVPVFIGF